jgi:hypothetical protein
VQQSSPTTVEMPVEASNIIPIRLVPSKLLHVSLSPPSKVRDSSPAGSRQLVESGDTSEYYYTVRPPQQWRNSGTQKETKPGPAASCSLSFVASLCSVLPVIPRRLHTRGLVLHMWVCLLRLILMVIWLHLTLIYVTLIFSLSHLPAL